MRRLMELQTKHQTLMRQGEDINYNAEKYQTELQDMDGKIDRAKSSAQAKINNVQDVRNDFPDSTDNKDIQLEIQKLKTKYLLNAIS